MKKDLIDLAEDIINEAFPEHITDKGGVPYIYHLKIVQEIASDLAIRTFGVRDQEILHNIIVIALLHDLLEDCPEWNEARLLDAIGLKEVVEAVVLLTKTPEQPYEAYIERISEHQLATIVKIADLSHNLNTSRLPELTEKDILRLKKYHQSYWKLIREYEKRYL